MGVMLSDTQNAASAVTLPVHHTRMHARTHAHVPWCKPSAVLKLGSGSATKPCPQPLTGDSSNTLILVIQ